jgi:hypothetical protein
MMKATRSTLLSVSTMLAACLVARFASAQEPAASGRSGQSEASLAGGTPISAELNSSIDSKKAKAGDAVMAHTTEAVKSTDDRTILPKGTKLVGHITQASARSKGDGESTLGIGFDKAILKGGEEVPLNLTIQALAAPASYASTAPDVNSMPSPSGPSNVPGGSTRNPPMSDNRSSGRPDGPAGSTGSYPSTSAGSEPTAAEELPPNSRGVIGLKGLKLGTAPVNNTQVSVLTSDGKNVHLDSGTRLLLVTQTLASGTGK